MIMVVVMMIMVAVVVMVGSSGGDDDNGGGDNDDDITHALLQRICKYIIAMTALHNSGIKKRYKKQFFGTLIFYILFNLFL